jgi:hypothetical protein
VPEHPHAYCLKTWVRRPPEFDRFVALITQHGYPGRFRGRNWIYLDIDGFKYWESKTLDRRGLIVNRARLDAVPDERRPRTVARDEGERESSGWTRSRAQGADGHRLLSGVADDGGDTRHRANDVVRLQSGVRESANRQRHGRDAHSRALHGARRRC